MTFADQIVAGTRLIRNDIHSPNFVTGVSGWIIRKDGTAEFADVVIRGEVWLGVAPDGQIHLYTAAGVGYIDFWTNYVGEVDPGYLVAEWWNDGVNDLLDVMLVGPTDVAGAAPWLRLGRVAGGGGYTFLDAEAYIVQLTTGQGLIVLVDAVGQPAFRMAVTGDANYRVRMDGDGSIHFGDGVNPPDASISRLGAGVLQVDSGFQVNGDLTITGHTLNVANIFPRLRAGTTTSVVTTAVFVAETVTDSVNAFCIQGKTYAIEFRGGWRSTAAGDIVAGKIRQDNIAGTVIQDDRTHITAAGSVNHGHLYAQYTHAVANAWKTFVVTGARSAGAGNISRCAGATFPSYLYVDQIN